MFDHLLHQFSNSGLSLRQVFAWVGLLAVAYLVWQSWRGGHDFQIILRRGNVRIVGRFPASKQSEVTHFLLHDMALQKNLCIRGDWGPMRVVKIHVAGRINDGQRQCIRNFLKMSLGG